MKLRHAAALALVGWYLMIPPALPNGQPNLGAPLSQWGQGGDFDTAAACHKAYGDRLALAKKALGEVARAIDLMPESTKNSKKPLSQLDPDLYKADLEISLFALHSAAARCIASDDPRLAK
jgi:hypothetical protein